MYIQTDLIDKTPDNGRATCAEQSQGGQCMGGMMERWYYGWIFMYIRLFFVCLFMFLWLSNTIGKHQASEEVVQAMRH